MKKIVLIFLLLGWAGVSLFADVIRMKDGRIFIGSVGSIDPQGVHIQAFGEKLAVPLGDIISTENDFSMLKDQDIEITLKDQSVMRGKIKNYDEDIGFQLEINFGIITVPLENVKSIQDPVQRGRHTANFVQIGFTGGYFFMAGDLASTFGNNVNFQVFGEFNLGFLMEGLFTGASVSYHNLATSQTDSYTYLLVDVRAMALYRFLQLRTLPGPARNIVPFVGAGAGVAIPLMTYGGATQMEADFLFTGTAGLDFFINDGFLVRLNGEWVTIMQTSLWFNYMAINLGVAFSF